MKEDFLNLKGLSGLYTDFYELTMAQGYFLKNKHLKSASFDYVFRKNPFGNGFTIFAGLSDILNFIENFSFNDEAINYLRTNNFNDEFLAYLRDFKFNGNIYAAREGEIVFPNEPLFRAEGTIIETQVIETAVMNFLNYQSLVATKAARLRRVAGDRILFDFGMRRAQNFASIHGSKAVIIGGLNGTSNVFSAYCFGTKASGTQAHSWIQSFDDELTAFREFAKIYPENCVLLVDTYNTLKIGVPNVIKVAKEMEERGERLLAIRLDSGDLAYLSKKARIMLDEAGLQYVKIAASNQLDEYLIKSLLEQGAPIDIFGVGTNLITGKDDAALDGVYKLTYYDGNNKMKFSDNVDKIVLPGRKNILRIFDEEGFYYGDCIVSEEEQEVDMHFHPVFSYKFRKVKGMRQEPLLSKVIDNGKIICPTYSVSEIAAYSKERLKWLPEEHRRFENPHEYKVGISGKLSEMKENFISNLIKSVRDEF